MSDTYEVVVIGAGMFGSAAAKHLAQAGAEVLVIGPAEPEVSTEVTRYSFGAHFDEARITRRLGWDPVWGALDSRSLTRFRDMEDESGIGFFHECGSLVVMARSIHQRTDSILAQCDHEGISVERMSEATLAKEFPALGIPSIAGGVEGLLERRQAGYLNPRRLVEVQLSLSRKAGGQVRRAAVTSITKDLTAKEWRLRVEVEDTWEEIWAKRVLIATGAFTNENNVLPAGYRLAMHAFTEPNLLFEISNEQLPLFRDLPAVVTVDPGDTGDSNASLYLIPPIRYPNGRWYLRIGPGMQPIVQELQTVEQMTRWCTGNRLMAGQEAFLSNMMRVLIPNLRPADIQRACCIIEKTPSRYPYIGHISDDKSLTVAVGGNGHGARGSDEIGRLAAMLVLENPWDCPIPEETFKPKHSSASSRLGSQRPDFLKPPFGLC
jgi:sarcosine oxidase